MIGKLYSMVRGQLPPKYQSVLTRMVFALPWKPYVRHDGLDPSIKFPGKQRGGLILSADFEMSWALRYSKKSRNFLELGRRERENVPQIVKMLEEYNIPVTWATVGHLFLKECRKGDHDWMSRIPHFDDHWRFTEGDWFDHDPCSDYLQDGEWYAPDLIGQILQSKVGHEMGCHTFSHIDCTYKNCPPQVLDDELTACARVAADYRLKLTSMVFPGGTAGNFEILKKHGYRIYRKNIRAELAYPFYDEHGLLITPTSASIADNGLGWSKEYYLYRYKKYIDKAIRTHTVAHLWFHPSIDPRTLHEVFPQVLKYAATRRDAGKLWIGTMGEMADHIFRNKIISCQPSSE
ncbi:MAG: polysaccharide deacetylase family protein [Bacteroidales bacterium]|nr:polysaccharide deacetylase family protein [Bacteroidales bacterium]